MGEGLFEASLFEAALLAGIMPKTFPTNWVALASSLLFLGAILFVVTREQSFDALVDVWNRTEPDPFALAVLAMIALQSTAAWRLETIMGAEKLDEVHFWPLMRIQLVSQFVANAAPISALSDLAKAAMIKLRLLSGPDSPSASSYTNASAARLGRSSPVYLPCSVS